MMMRGFGERGFDLYGMHGAVGGLVGGLFMLVFWIALILLIAVGIRWLVTSTGTAPSGQGAVSEAETALDILKRRYAQGEIDTVEFEERKKALGT